MGLGGICFANRLLADHPDCNSRWSMSACARASNLSMRFRGCTIRRIWVKIARKPRICGESAQLGRATAGSSIELLISNSRPKIIQECPKTSSRWCEKPTLLQAMRRSAGWSRSGDPPEVSSFGIYSLPRAARSDLLRLLSWRILRSSSPKMASRSSTLEMPLNPSRR